MSMYCKNCGAEVKDGAGFCKECGNPLSNVADGVSLKQVQYYGKDWKKYKGFAIASLPHYDVLIDDEFIYIIDMPAGSASTWGLIIGLILLNIIGAFIGALIGENHDSKKREGYRSTWINDSDELVSRKFEALVSHKIPISNAANVIAFKTKSFEFTKDGKVIGLKKNKEAIEAVSNIVSK